MVKKLIYRNLLCRAEDVADFVMEGKAKVTFERGRMRLASTEDPSKGQKANYVFWCPENFPSDVELSWNFYPLSDEGLCMMFISGSGWDGRDLFDGELVRRDGQYDCYFDGDINAFHASYYRRKARTERGFRTCNLRKSKGFYLVAQGADPIPELKAVSYTHLDGAENNELALTNNKHGEVAKYYSYNKHQMVPDMLIGNLRFLNGLPEDERKIFDEAARISTQVELTAWEEQVEQAKTLAKDKMGVEFIDVDVDLFKKKVLPLHEKMLKENPAIREVYEHIQKINEQGKEE